MKQVLTAGALANLPLLAQAAGELKPVPEPPTPVPAPESSPAPTCSNGNANLRRTQAYNLRVEAAWKEFQRPVPPHPTNGDEERYPNKVANFCKGMPHNDLGEVDLDAYDTYLHALATGRWKDFEKIPLGWRDPNHRYKFVNLQAGLAFDLEGADSHALYMPPP
ncbi:MAG TPA: hypothetical protein VNZ22_00420, partial [Bacillota bacterium]|nr:hypothetical protein [Bacillota bacterium]